jgi:Flp pilus assembly protein TadG
MRLAGFIGDTRAAVAAEMAMILPGIAFVMLNVVDLSSYIWSRMQVDLAAHEAVGAARALCADDEDLPATENCADLDATMAAAAQTTSLGANVTIAADATEEHYYCADAEGELQEVAAADGTPPADCSGTVTGSTSAPGLYIRTTVSYPFSPVFPGASVASLLGSPITRTAWLRLQ